MNAVTKYTLGKNADGQEWIECNTCLMRSYNPNDVQHRYCAFCDVFHDDPFIEFPITGGDAE